MWSIRLKQNFQIHTQYACGLHFTVRGFSTDFIFTVHMGARRTKACLDVPTKDVLQVLGKTCMEFLRRNQNTRLNGQEASGLEKTIQIKICSSLKMTRFEITGSTCNWCPWNKSDLLSMEVTPDHVLKTATRTKIQCLPARRKRCRVIQKNSAPDVLEERRPKQFRTSLQSSPTFAGNIRLVADYVGIRIYIYIYGTRRRQFRIPT